jgi:signal transduction histidine kinase
LLTALAASSGPLVAARGEPVAPPLAAELAELGAAARLDRFFVFSLDQGTRERPGGPAVVMLIGGTEARARYHAAVGRDSELLPMLSILLTQAAAALRNAQLYQELLDERNSLDDKVKARTGELSQANQDLTVALLKTRESERVKMEFLANVSHELRTPLNSIINLPDGLLLDFPRVPAVTCACCQASFALEPGEVVAGTDSCPTCGAVAGFAAVETVVYQGEPAQTRQYLETVVRCGRHLLSVVNDILDASRLEAGRVELHEERVELATVVDDVSRAVGALAAQRGLQLVLPTLDASQTLFGDRVRLAQILINLLGNAIKFSHPGGRVTLQVECPEDAVRFVIADQGIGIAVADQERIFESFRQVDGGHTRRFGGSGLGLAITRQLVLLHQGRVWLRSQLGEGSTFFVELPRRPGPRTAVSGAPGGSS